MLSHWVYIWDIIISDLAKTQVTYVRLFSLGENINTSIYQMVVANSPYIYQQKMNDLFHGFEFIRAYMDHLLILTKGGWTDHVQKL